MPKQTLKDKITNLLSSRHLLTVAEILELLAKQKKSYNKTSVYRALDSMLDSEEICKHYFTDAEAAYELRSHHHTHLVCTSCGEISHVDCTYKTPPLAGFKANHHHVTIMGTCKQCQEV